MTSNSKNSDDKGHITLNVIEKADLFNEWMYKTITVYSKGRILEIGSGIGNISKYFIRDNKEIVLSDIDDNYCKILKEKFNKTVLNIDLVHPDFDKEYLSLLNSFDSIIALNIIEHIEDDNLAVANCKKLLKSGGNLILLVPAYQFLYSSFDIGLNHYRRYSKKSLKNIVSKNDLKIKKLFHFNVIGILGWVFYGKLLRKKVIPEKKMKLFNFFTPVLKFVDIITLNKIGLSVVCVSEKELRLRKIE